MLAAAAQPTLQLLQTTVKNRTGNTSNHDMQQQQQQWLNLARQLLLPLIAVVRAAQHWEAVADVAPSYVC